MRWNLDLAVSKLMRITERVSTRFDVQFVNAFNHVMFGSGGDSYFSNQPGMDISGPGAFGVPSNQYNSPRDRKSTRLNSSHSQISYAVFCLKKKIDARYVHHILHRRLQYSRLA